MIEINISIRGRGYLGRWYPNPDRISIFINKIVEWYPNNWGNDDEIIDSFINTMCAVEFHELGHVYGFRNGCKSKTCSKGECWWCNIMEDVREWLKYGW